MRECYKWSFVWHTAHYYSTELNVTFRNLLICTRPTLKRFVRKFRLFSRVFHRDFSTGMQIFQSNFNWCRSRSKQHPFFLFVNTLKWITIMRTLNHWNIHQQQEKYSISRWINNQFLLQFTCVCIRNTKNTKQYQFHYNRVIHKSLNRKKISKKQYKNRTPKTKENNWK